MRPAGDKLPRHFFHTDSLLVTHLPNVRYLTGFTGSSGCALITPRQKLFFTDFRYRQQACLEVKGFGVRITPGAALEGACRYATGRGLRLGVLGYDGAHLRHGEYLLLRRLLRGVKMKNAAGAVEEMRMVKQKSEIRRVGEACRLVDDAYRRLARSRVVGRPEKEVAWMLEKWLREAGSGPLPFGIIVASGPRAAMPHGAAGDRVIRKGEVVVVDMGASVDGYASDATRTFATGRLPRRLSQIYGLVREAQESAVAGCLAGAAGAAVDALARDHIAAAGHGDEFGHALGHGVGLEAHESPVLSKRSHDKLKAGMVITIEPGVYVEGLGGVRIEDTVLVTARGPERLTGFSRKIEYLK